MTANLWAADATPDEQELLAAIGKAVTGDPHAKVLVLAEDSAGIGYGCCTEDELAEIRGLMYRAAAGLPGR